MRWTPTRRRFGSLTWGGHWCWFTSCRTGECARIVRSPLFFRANRLTLIMINGQYKSVISFIEIVWVGQLLLHRGSAQFFQSFAALLVLVSILHLTSFGPAIFPRLHLVIHQLVYLIVLAFASSVNLGEEIVNLSLRITVFMVVML